MESPFCLCTMFYEILCIEADLPKGCHQFDRTDCRRCAGGNADLQRVRIILSSGCSMNCVEASLHWCTIYSSGLQRSSLFMEARIPQSNDEGAFVSHMTRTGGGCPLYVLPLAIMLSAVHGNSVVAALPLTSSHQQVLQGEATWHRFNALSDMEDLPREYSVGRPDFESFNTALTTYFAGSFASSPPFSLKPYLTSGSITCRPCQLLVINFSRRFRRPYDHQSGKALIIGVKSRLDPGRIT